MSYAETSQIPPAKLAELEKSWNSNIRLLRDIAQPRRHAQMESDIKSFVFKAVEGDPSFQAEKKAVIRSLKTASSNDSYSRIASTLNFVHHEGSDSSTEMKVVKIILSRETMLMTLQHMNEKIAKFALVDDKSCLRILETLAQIRESTLNFLEALCVWRQSIRSGQTVSTRPFMWEGRNYTLRIVTDLDFIANNLQIINALKISPEQFRSNPLMLTNNLNDVNTWMEPTDRAAQDAGGARQGALYENRLKLRYAERILLQEIEINAGTDSSVARSGPANNGDLFQGFGSVENSISTRSAWGADVHPALENPAFREINNTSGRNSPQAAAARAYLMPMPGYDPSMLPGAAGRRPESRNAANSASTPGAIARRTGRGQGQPEVSVSLDSGLRSASQLPPVDTRQKAALQASGLFAPEDEFPSPPESRDDRSSNRPVSRSVLLKSGIEVTPYHTEVVTDIYKYPLLIALLTSASQDAKKKNQQSQTGGFMKATMSTASKSRDEYDDGGMGSGLAQVSLFGSPQPPRPSFDRLVVKVFDVIGHSECIINATISEYVAYRAELEAKYETGLSDFFLPEDREWWKNNIRYLIRIQLKRNGMLHMTISKQSIEELVVVAMKKAAEESASMQFSRRATKAMRRTIVRSSSSKSGMSGSPGAHNLVSNNSERSVVVASALEDDYDYDFDP